MSLLFSEMQLVCTINPVNENQNVIRQFWNMHGWLEQYSYEYIVAPPFLHCFSCNSLCFPFQCCWHMGKVRWKQK